MVLLLGLGCGDDDGSTAIDADVLEDAGADAMVDAGGPDAFDPCPGKTSFQVGVVDWSSNMNLPGISVQEGDGANVVTSAPNGRVVLCIENSGPVTIRFSGTGYLDRVHSTTAEIAAEQFESTTAPSFRLLSAAQADTLYTGASNTRDTADTTVIAMVRKRPEGTELAGATVSLGAANEGGYTPNAGDVDLLDSGATSVASGRVLFLNTDVATGMSSFDVTGQTGCLGPPDVALEADAVSSVAIVCGP
jgi:hypothetical protein